jgi:hypothetical protein
VNVHRGHLTVSVCTQVGQCPRGMKGTRCVSRGAYKCIGGMCFQGEGVGRQQERFFSWTCSRTFFSWTFFNFSWTLFSVFHTFTHVIVVEWIREGLDIYWVDVSPEMMGVITAGSLRRFDFIMNFFTNFFFSWTFFLLLFTSWITW